MEKEAPSLTALTDLAFITPGRMVRLYGSIVIG